ncbi:HAD hydrolase family protein [Sulfurovum sp. ST-21]|uniref:HAD family phosphatase n=1 Tax=Sulfurovum indicum TaxID=2779528 RepID=A0A7M1S0G3_9BACT|nr:HAD family hydrolase [Sulfurovum indicum]QOR61005.1 HAD family phosphatase [Sulfurovum indicum]
MKPIYITDLDHTFLRSDLSLSPFSIETWNQKARDALMGVATARSFSKSKELLEKLHINAPMILLDGSIIVTPQRELIDMKTLGKEMGDAIVEVGLQYDIDPFIIGVKDNDLNEAFLYPRKLNDYQKEVLKGYKDDPRMQFNPDNRTMEKNLKIVYFGYEDQLSPLYEAIKHTFGKEIEAKLSPEKYGGGWFLTLLHPEGDKSHALSKVIDYLGQDPSDVTVFGDSVNDVGMFKLAGTSVAVSNALDEVKALADVVLPHSNDEDGVAKYLNSL